MKLSLCIIILALFVISCIGQDPCAEVNCGTICREETLWQQKCSNGECIDDQIIEQHSPECGYDPCKSIVCSDTCSGTDLWKMTCLDGECVQDSLVEKDSALCGFIPETSAPEPEPPEILLDPEEYAVYNTLIVEGFDLIASCFRSLDQIQYIVINDYTGTEESDPDELASTLEWVNEKMPALKKETIENFKIKNEKSYSLSDEFTLPVKVILLSEEEEKEIFVNDSGWDAFYKRYPSSQGIMILSRVGFNSTMDQALVYVGSQCDWLFGGGYYVLFTRENGVWTIQDEVMTWIS